MSEVERLRALIDEAATILWEGKRVGTKQALNDSAAKARKLLRSEVPARKDP